MNNFDVFVSVDWSGSKAPKRTHSIALAACKQGDYAPETIMNPASRQDVYDWITTQIRSGQRTLIGVDCNFGYARAVMQRQFGPSVTHMDLWRAVDDACGEHDNFFAGGYWHHNPIFWTQGKKPEGFTMPRRLTEQACGEAGLGWPESPFKLIGAKQVGKGGLAGMRMALALRQDWGDHVAFWPFDSMEACNKAAVVMVEIYPRQFIRRADMGNAKIRDAVALNQCLKKLGAPPVTDNTPVNDHVTDALVSAAGLRHLCGPGKVIPSRFSRPIGLGQTYATCEGWIFGVEGE